jgi:hypothetical protein
MATVQLDITEYNDLKLSYAALKQKIRSEIEEEIHRSYRTDLEQFRKVANEANENFLKAMSEVERLEFELKQNTHSHTLTWDKCKSDKKAYDTQLNLKNLEIQDLTAQKNFISKSYQEIKVKLENTVSKSEFDVLKSTYDACRSSLEATESQLKHINQMPLIVKLEESELKVSELKAYKQLYEEAIKPKTFIQKFKQLFQ